MLKICFSKSFHLENLENLEKLSLGKLVLYGFYCQSGRSGNAKVAFVAALAKPNQNGSVAFCTKQQFVLPILSFLLLVEWIKRLLLIQ